MPSLLECNSAQTTQQTSCKHKKQWTYIISPFWCGMKYASRLPVHALLSTWKSSIAAASHWQALPFNVGLIMRSGMHMWVKAGSTTEHVQQLDSVRERERVQCFSQSTPLLTLFAEALMVTLQALPRDVFMMRLASNWCQEPGCRHTSAHRPWWLSNLRSAARWLCMWNSKPAVVICACLLCADHSDCSRRDPQEYTLTLPCCQLHWQALSLSDSASNTVFQSRTVSYYATAKASI